MTVGVTLYGLSRFFDEYIWLPHGKGGVAVEIASLAFVGLGAAFAAWLLWRERSAALEGGASNDPWASPLAVPLAGTAEEADGGTFSDEDGPTRAGTASEGGAQVSDGVPFGHDSGVGAGLLDE